MSSVHAICSACSGSGGAFGDDRWVRCAECDGLGTSWAQGAPSYGCKTTLGDTTPGEIITLGNGDQGRVLWHMPRRTKKIRPEITFLGLIEPFTELETHTPIRYPSCVGVSSVDVSKNTADDSAHANERNVDLSDPVQRTIAGRLM